MKAMILAAGMGTRLKQLTDNRPKCLMPLAGRPLIEWTLSWLKEHGVTECVINLHYLPEQVKAFICDGSQFGLKVHYSFEQILLGTAGAVKKVADFFDEPFYLIYGDNFSQWNLQELRDVFELQRTIAVMAVHWREDVSQSGMIEIAADGQIAKIIEKPTIEDVTSHYVNAGFFFMDPGIFQFIPPDQYCDFSYDVFPKVLQAGQKMYAVKMDETIIGIDTLEAYAKANVLAEKISLGIVDKGR
ncbi:MAG: nucleotidyl transferase [bacterium]|nr:MAG: nucleotidyl transferase [bacterium]